MSGLTYPQATPNNRFERSRVASSVSQGGGVDDLDKVPSFDAGATPRRSTSSLRTSPLCQHIFLTPVSLPRVAERGRTDCVTLIVSVCRSHL